MATPVKGEEERTGDADHLPDEKAEGQSPTVRGHGASRNLSKAAHFSCREFDATTPSPFTSQPQAIYANG
jgi:hypothetical protein